MEETKKITKQNYLKYLFNRILCKRQYKKLIAKSQTQIEKELDLHKFIHRIRLLVTAAMSLLTTQQSVFVDINSKIVVRESSVSGETTSDNELKN